MKQLRWMISMVLSLVCVHNCSGSLFSKLFVRLNMIRHSKSVGGRMLGTACLIPFSPLNNGVFEDDARNYLNSISLPESELQLADLTADDGTLFMCRNVPGDGSCLFHAITAGMVYHQLHCHANFRNKNILSLSQSLRRIAAEVLRQANEKLYCDTENRVSAVDIVNMAALFYNVSASEYCELIRKPQTWGGGPEIIALSNYFRRPIHVYELYTKGYLFWKSFGLRLHSCIGSSQAYRRCDEPICILSVDGRFPSLSPGQQKSEGDHFWFLFRANNIF